MSSSGQPSILDQFAKRARRLYSLPAVALQVLELTRQPNTDSRSLKECIENDPALAAKILRVANSPMFGLSQQVTDLGQAVTLLGAKPLKLLVLGFSLPKTLLIGVEATVLERYWRHTLIKSVAAREISETLWNLPGDDAFVAGLVQDIGMLALVQDLADAFGQFVERIFEEGGDLQALEMATLGFDHATLSAEMLKHWGFPDAIVRAVAFPHDAQQVQQLPEHERDLPQILHLAELVTELLTQQRPHLLNRLLEAGSLYRGLTRDQLEILVRSLEQKVPQLAEVLSLTLPDRVDYGSILLEAYRQLADMTDDCTLHGFCDHTQEGAVLAETRALSAAVERFTSVSQRGPSTTTSAIAPAKPRSTSVAIQPGLTEHRTAVRPTDDRALLRFVSAAVGRCRQARRPISLLLAELDDFASVLASGGPERASQTIRMLKAAIEETTGHDVLSLTSPASRLALILEDYDRQQGIEFGRQIVDGVRQWSLDRGGPAVSVSAGLATLAMPPKNLASRELIDAAERCLHGVQLSGGDSIKSIDIY
jgi:HD-like signal output (HDOD) protein